jgi:two-component system, chemotaxis family, chemotaxis protein CheY
MSKKILIIDDAIAIRQVVSMVLNEEGYDIIEAGDGLEALEKLDGQNIDLFICDVNMPNMNGLEFLEKVKKDEVNSAYKFIPFIMLTTESGESMQDKAKELGAKVWLIKPFQPDQLLDYVVKIIG